MPENFAFLASPFGTGRMKRLRRRIYELGEHHGLPIWVAEQQGHDRPAESVVEQFAIIDACMAAVQASRHLILVTDGSIGSALRYADASLASSYLEMEIFQAAALEKPIHFLHFGKIDPNSQLGKLLVILRFAFGGSVDQQLASDDEVL